MTVSLKTFAACTSRPEDVSTGPERGRYTFSAVMRMCAVVLMGCLLVQSQIVEPEKDTTTFQSKVQLVLVDVVLTDHLGQPLKGVPRDSFEVFENGQPQTITSFEEHRGDQAALPVPRGPLPPHSYTNAPIAEPPSAVNVLLLDGLNTDFGDQASVRGQAIKYLQRLEPGPQIAIFSLGAKLRMVTGFTDDPKLLLSVLNQPKRGGTPTASSMLPSAQEDRMQQTMLHAMAGTTPDGMGTLAPAGMIEGLANFMQQMEGVNAGVRISLTLHALQELSRYLNGFHGRKNIVWFAGSFPEMNFPAGGERTRVDWSGGGLEREMRETINRMAAAQIAVYPVAAQGLDTQGLYQAQSLTPMGNPGQALGEQMITGKNIAMQKERELRYENQKAARDIASNTGGQAFYNTNGLADVLAEVVHKGAYYYRIFYSPSDKRTEGRYRRIQIKVKKGSYASPGAISYRHGYFEEDGKRQKASKIAGPDFLQPLMASGLPDSTELIYHLRLVRSPSKPNPGSIIGEKRDFHGPVTRFSADFIAPIDKLEFDTTPDGVRHGDVELALVAYDQAGNPLNWIFKALKTTVKPEIYPLLQKTGAQFHQDIDVPDGDNYLRAGIYDLQADRSGTLQVALNKVTEMETVDTRRPSAVDSPVLATLTLPSVVQPADAVGGFRLMPTPATTPALWQALESAPSPEQIQKALPPDIPQYCATLAGSDEHSQALQNICQFAFAMRRKLPDVICERETRRYRNDRRHAEKMLNKLAQRKSPDKNYFDVVTAKVAYLNGREYYNEVRMNGAPVDAAAPWRAGSWSIGEFSSILVSIFLPSSKPEFRFEKEELLQSTPAVVFDYHVSAQNNTSYWLSSDGKMWFPEYFGKLWLDKATHQLLRAVRETPDMPHYPIRRVKTQIDYAKVALGDGTSLVLPTASSALICSQLSDYCGINIMAFGGWQKFGATSKIVTSPAN